MCAKTFIVNTTLRPSFDHPSFQQLLLMISFGIKNKDLFQVIWVQSALHVHCLAVPGERGLGKFPTHSRIHKNGFSTPKPSWHVEQLLNQRSCCDVIIFADVSIFRRRGRIFIRKTYRWGKI